jgi:DNA-binding beta-propeller fold protein YncE
MLAISHDGRRGYTANVGPGTVSVLDLVARKTLTVIPVAGTVQRISISADDKYVFTSDQTKPELDVIDTATNTVSRRIAMPATGYGSAATRDGRWLVVALAPVNKVAVIDLKSMPAPSTCPQRHNTCSCPRMALPPLCPAIRAAQLQKSTWLRGL